MLPHTKLYPLHAISSLQEQIYEFSSTRLRGSK
jgi:hypothetical protein